MHHNRLVHWLAICLALVALGALEAGPAWAGGGGGGTGEGGVNPLAPERLKADAALWTAVVFLVLLAVLTKFAWRPLLSGLEKRERRVAEQIAQAEDANRQSQQLLAQHAEKLAAAEAEVRAMLEQARHEAAQSAQRLLDQAKAEALTERQRALRQINAATASALKELAERSATLAVELAGKILHAKLEPRDHARLIEEAVNQFTTSEPSSN
jgi:F-type H+-transporting ATPase subunit b